MALGDDLEAIQLFADAKPGDKVLVAVKLLPTVDEKQFDHVDLNISFAPTRPNPEDLREELVSAAALVPSLAPGSAADRATLSRSIAEVDFAALERPSSAHSAGPQAAFDASLRQAQATLMALRPMLRQATLHPYRQLAYRRGMALAVDPKRWTWCAARSVRRCS